ncbi:hypothetical protein ON010_g14262 [Phytophthora cinnamomi]|nr:hypothetical protein ON010_g14262 [Phytophthora cinnamomi]
MPRHDLQAAGPPQAHPERRRGATQAAAATQGPAARHVPARAAVHVPDQPRGARDPQYSAQSFADPPECGAGVHTRAAALHARVFQGAVPLDADVDADKKASSRIVECVYDPEWLTYIPSHDKSTWDSGSTEFNATERGIGWRKDRGMPLERNFLVMIEKAVGEDIKLEEIERFFPDDPSKKPISSQQKSRHDTPTTSDDFAPPSKKKRGGGGAGGSQGPGTGVCYDFQNKGVCQRPSYRRNDYDAPPSPEVPPSSIVDATSVPDKSPSLRHTNSFERDSKNDGAGGEEEEAGELTDNNNLHINSIYAPLENFDKETIAAKRAQLAALGNRRIWASLGLEDKPQRTRPCGLIVSKTGEVAYVRALEK